LIGDGMAWIPLDDFLEDKIGGYRVPSPAELARKEKKKRAKAAGVKQSKRKAKKRAGGGLSKKPPKQQMKPGGSKAKAKVDQIPAQLAHCVLAVRGGKPSKKGGKPQKKYGTRAAWNICRWSLTRHGYLKPPYKKGGQVSSLRRTQKGARASMKHAMEKEGPTKYKRFKDLFRDIEPTV
jgi:hypothetical protein